MAKFKGVIPAGGHGSRLRPITHTTQKQLIPIANKPLIYYVIEDLAEIGCEEVAVIVGPNKEKVKECVGQGERWGIQISYIEQDHPRGLAHCVLIAEEFVGKDNFIMYLGDNLLIGGIQDMVKSFSSDASIMLTPVKNPSEFGVAVVDEKGHVVRLIEKPKEPPSNLILVGIYAFTPSIFHAARQIKPSFRGELEITDALQWLLSNGQRVQSSLVQGYWKDTGKPEDLLEGNRLVLDHAKDDLHLDLQGEASAVGRGIVSPGVVVKGKSLIRGPVALGENVVIEDSYIGPYTSIGAGSVIRNTEIEHSIALERVQVVGAGRLVDCIVGCEATIQARGEGRPAGRRLVIGDNSTVEM